LNQVDEYKKKDEKSNESVPVMNPLSPFSRSFKVFKKAQNPTSFLDYSDCLAFI
jgi:hypothetical protein